MCGPTNASNNETIQGVPITFNSLEYAVPLKQGEKFTILKGISGAFVPGKLTALMGPSGSGKSTLMDCLSGRKNSGALQGDLLYAGRKPSTSTYRLMVGYVEQFDTLVGELTVEQMLSYTAELKLPSSFTAEDRAARVNEVIEMLDLESCRKTVIGSSLSRGISGGQAKRVNIGLALITRPPVLFLDEPTSGLDSKTANEVCELLKKLAHEGGRTIVCTIHSPSGHAFSLFDDLYMIVKGRTVYDGAVSQVQSYFEGLGHARDPDSSLPEWLVDLTGNFGVSGSTDLQTYNGMEIDVDEFIMSSQTKGKSSSNFSELFESSQFKKDKDEERRQLLKDLAEGGSTKTYDVPPSQLSKLVTLLKYRTLAHYQDGEYLGPRFGDKLIFALLILSLYWQIGDNLDQQSIASTSSLLYLVGTLCGFGAAAFVPALNLERKLFYRELADGCYSPVTYFMNKLLEEAFIALFTSAVFCILVYFGCALTGTFGVFFFTYYLTTLCGVLLAYAIAAAVPSLEAANALLPLYVTICLFFGGLFIVFDKIPKGWQWFSWTSFLRYSWGAFMVDNYSDSDVGREPVFFDGEGNPVTVLEFYGMSEGPIMNNVGACIGMLSMLTVLFAALGMAAVVFIRHEKR